MELVILFADVIESVHLEKSICRDPDDDKFIACALSGGCPLIVSGDDDLLVLKEYKKIEVITPTNFVKNHLNDLSFYQ